MLHLQRYFTFEINLHGLASQVKSERAFWILEECLLDVLATYMAGVLR